MLFCVLIGHLYIFSGEVSIQVFCPLKKLCCLSFNYWFIRDFYILMIQVICQICVLQIFFPSLWLSFSFYYWCLLMNESFKLWWSKTYHFFLLWFMLSASSLRNLWLPQSCENILICFLPDVSVLVLMLGL